MTRYRVSWTAPDGKLPLQMLCDHLPAPYGHGWLLAEGAEGTAYERRTELFPPGMAATISIELIP